MREAILGPSPTFPGKVIVPGYKHARLEDIARLQDIEEPLRSGTAQVYWVDGSDRDGFLGAGIVWLEDGRFVSRGYHLGPNTVGNSGDTEVFAIAAALGRAKKHVQRGNTLALVKIFSDCSGVLDGIREGNCPALGPMLVKKTALEGIYARARWLQVHNVPVELVWVKGHSNSEGNRLADEIAGRAASAQAFRADATRPLTISTVADCPDLWRNLGQDWIDEWIWRADHGHSVSQRKLAKRMERMQKNAWQSPQKIETPRQLLLSRNKNPSTTLKLAHDNETGGHINSVTEQARAPSSEVIDLTSSPSLEAPPRDEISRLWDELQVLLAALNEREQGVPEPIRTTATLHRLQLDPKHSDAPDLIRRIAVLDKNLDTLRTIGLCKEASTKGGA
jgi:ribonuclease HI